MGLTPFPLPSWGFLSAWPLAGLGRGRVGNKLWVCVCAAPPAWVFCLAGLLALPTRFGEGGVGGLQHMKESLPLIIRSDESLLGKK